LPDILAKLKALLLCHVPTSSVVDLIRFVTEHSSPLSTGTGIRYVRLEGPVSGDDFDALTQLWYIVVDFQMTSNYCIFSETSLLAGLTMHFFLSRFITHL
jgi:hypothetical protein